MALVDTLITASSEGDVQRIQELLDSEEPEIIHSWDDEALHQAVRNGWYDATRYLIEEGANVKASSNYAIRMACKQGDLDLVILLNNSGAPLENECLIQASRYGNKELAEWLIAEGCSPFTRSYLPLRYAIKNGHLETAQMLVNELED